MYKERMIGYYPNVIRNIQEFQSIIDSEYPEFEETSNSVNRVTQDAWLSTMSEDRIKEWEELLEITPFPSSTLVDRREVIIARLRGQGKLNTELINSIVATFTGGTAISWFEDSVIHIEVQLPHDNKSFILDNLIQELELKIPAHLGCEITRRYSTWNEINDKYITWLGVKDCHDTWFDVLYNYPKEVINNE